MIAAVALYAALPERLTVAPSWVLPVLEAAVLAPLSVTVRQRYAEEQSLARVAAIVLIALINLANLCSLVLLVDALLHGSKAEGTQLVFAAMQIWGTNVIVFGLWYWELDRGGPPRRLSGDAGEPDFLFPQMNMPEREERGWRPQFVDYLYVSCTNALAFSPTDTMPLTHRAKLLMLLQSLASMLTVALVAARAVNILQ
ncbi:MAG: DUF1345 domain-containing protein [Chloroflexi bacterium]|nr:DUF1345 domain-containing protein [Chloroflexota bacterium]